MPARGAIFVAFAAVWRMLGPSRHPRPRKMQQRKMQQRATSRLRVERSTHVRPDARAERLFRQAVAQEMLQARESARTPAFDPNDARWMLATETQRALQGAVLAYEDRRRLLAMANRLGVRAFDANLILAIVQDRARRGEPLESAAATLAVIPQPAPRRLDLVPIWFAAILVAMLADAALIAWLIFH